MRGRFTGSTMGDEHRTRAAVDDLDRRLSQQETADVRIEAGRRLVLRSPNGHFWSVGVDNLGALTTTDLGTSL
jgi:hypothetical protein